MSTVWPEPAPSVARTDDDRRLAAKFQTARVLVHVGAHKTGTTWLQRQFFERAHGIVYCGDAGRSHQAFLLPEFGDFSPARVLWIFRDELEKAVQEDKPLVISDEGLGGRPFGQRFFRGVVAHRLKSAFPSARILLTIREQRSIAQSMYSEYLRYGFSSSLRAFITESTGTKSGQLALDHQFWEWDRALDFYSSVFGPDRVLAVPMEWGLSDKRNYQTLLEGFLQSSLDLVADGDVTDEVRPSLSTWALHVLRNANKLRPQDTRTLHRRSALSPNALAWRVDRLTPAWARKRGRAKQKALIQEMIADRFASSNARFSELSGIDLAALGYPVTRSERSEHSA